MRLLVIGGGQFLGRATVEAALAAGHDVTTFSRGHSAVPDGAEALHGDRENRADLAVLRGREWDAVVDTCGFTPRAVGDSARLLADAVGHYVFVSSLSAYEHWPEQPVRDDSPTLPCPPDAGPGDGHYGELKAGCERAVDRYFTGRATHVRAGLLVGPRDNVGRLPWWLQRVARGGEVLAPGDPGQPMALVDVRDLADWMLACAGKRLAGAYAASAPRGHTTFGELLALCRAVTGSAARFSWLPEEFLTEQGVRAWVELPLWMPKSEAAATWDVDTGAAERDGLACRPLVDTLTDTWRWLVDEGEPPLREPRPGLSPSKENALLVRWALRRRPS